MVEVDGRWYVSPVRTVLDSMVDGLRAMSPEDLQKIIDEWSDGFFGTSSEESFTAIGEAIPEDPTMGTVPDSDIDVYRSECDLLIDDVPSDAPDEDWDAAYDAYEQCLNEEISGPTSTSTTFASPPTTAQASSTTVQGSSSDKPG